MYQTLPEGKELLDTEDVANYLGVAQATVWRWCRDGEMPCMKIARSWRIRREALEAFLERSERSETLVGRLRPFLEIPDNVLAIAQNQELMHNLDAAFFRVGEARGGILVKFMSDESATVDELREDFEHYGLEVGRLEKEGRFRFIEEESDPTSGRPQELWGLLEEGIDKGRSVWANFNWKHEIDLETAFSQQAKLSQFVEDSQLVVKTAVLEEVLDEWPGADLRRAQVVHSGTIWLSESGLSLNRVTPPPST
jgi:excisionase family DNA binding protein